MDIQDDGTTVLKVYNGGKLGVGDMTGISSLTEVLEVNGAVKVGDATGTANGTIKYASGDFFGRKAGSWLSLTIPTKIESDNTKVEVTDSGSNGYIAFTTDNVERMRIDSAGNVGIGKADPAGKFHALGADGKSIVLDGTGNTEGVYLSGYDGWATIVNQLHTSDGHGLLIDLDHAETDKIGLRLTNTNGTLFTIQSDGDVGIGTDAPTTDLEILSDDDDGSDGVDSSDSSDSSESSDSDESEEEVVEVVADRKRKKRKEKRKKRSS